MPRLQSKNTVMDGIAEWEGTQSDRFNALLSIDISRLLRESSTEYNFLELKNQVNNVLVQVEVLKENYDFWRQLSESKRVHANQCLDDMIGQFHSMLAFDPKQNSAWDLRNSLVTDFKNYYNNFYEHLITPLSAYLGSKAFSEELSSEFGKKAKEELAEISRVKSEIEKIQIDVSEAAQVAGDKASSAQSVSFGDQAGEHQRAAEAWLRALIWVGLASSFLIITIVIDFLRAMYDKGFKENLEGYVIKAVILGLVFFSVRFIIRNYSANKHLYIINKHRANTLSSILAFRDSAISDSAKDTILLAGVSSAFSHQETGFLTTKEGAGGESNEITEIVQSITRR